MFLITITTRRSLCLSLWLLIYDLLFLFFNCDLFLRLFLSFWTLTFKIHSTCRIALFNLVCFEHDLPFSLQERQILIEKGPICKTFRPLYSLLLSFLHFLDILHSELGLRFEYRLTSFKSRLGFFMKLDIILGLTEKLGIRPWISSNFAWAQSAMFWLRLSKSSSPYGLTFWKIMVRIPCGQLLVRIHLLYMRLLIHVK